MDSLVLIESALGRACSRISSFGIILDAIRITNSRPPTEVLCGNCTPLCNDGLEVAS